MSVGFHLPEATSTVSLSIAIAEVMRQKPHLFREGVKIASFFGCVPVKWNGGRMLMGKMYPERVRSIIEAYNERGIPYRFTFTNPHITEKELGDKECNLLLDMADNGMNEVIVVSEVLENYIRKTHPNMKITSSTCKCIRNIDDVKAELAKPYSLVVLDYNFNNQPEELEKLTMEERARCEILSNPVCIPNCPRRAEHYSYIGKVQLEKLDETRKYAQFNERIAAQIGIKEWDCAHRRLFLFDNEEHPLRLTADDIYNKFVPMGFVNFKVEGRRANMMYLCEQIVRYMASPEHIDEARVDIMATALECQYLNY